MRKKVSKEADFLGCAVSDRQVNTKPLQEQRTPGTLWRNAAL